MARPILSDWCADCITYDNDPEKCTLCQIPANDKEPNEHIGPRPITLSKSRYDRILENLLVAEQKVKDLEMRLRVKENEVNPDTLIECRSAMPQVGSVTVIEYRGFSREKKSTLVSILNMQQKEIQAWTDGNDVFVRMDEDVDFHRLTEGHYIVRFPTGKYTYYSSREFVDKFIFIDEFGGRDD